MSKSHSLMSGLSTFMINRQVNPIASVVYTSIYFLSKISKYYLISVTQPGVVNVETVVFPKNCFPKFREKLIRIIKHRNAYAVLLIFLR